MRSGKQESLRWILEGPDEDLTSDEHASARTSSLLAQQIVARYSLFWPEAVSANREHSPGNGAAQVCTRATRTLTGWASRGPSTNPPFGQTGENSPGRDKLCLGGGPHDLTGISCQPGKRRPFFLIRTLSSKAYATSSWRAAKNPSSSHGRGHR